LRAFLRSLPEYDYLYLGDNARAPYGNKSIQVIHEYTRQAVEFLFERGCVLIILACNTASAKALRKIQQEWLPYHSPNNRVLGVTIPLAEAGTQVTRYGRVGIIGTRATIESKVYEQELDKLRSDLKVYGMACPLLVPLVEEGWVGEGFDRGRGSPTARRIAAISCCWVTMISCARMVTSTARLKDSVS